MKKSNLDEMQEQALLKIEHNGCWLAFWGLLAAMALQMVMRVPGRQMLGEWIVFMALSLYIVIACLRKGIWDRHLKANRKTNLIVSLLAAVATGIFVILSNPYLSEPLDYVLVAGLTGGFTFVLCFAALSVCTKLYRNRRNKLDKE
ncbi:MAG: hypothetical protein MR762_00230 [Clostridiales bacterium]|nr:hypothetical protein [Clostridiales bacterium]MCI6935074.1 hypothetical protein [Clostridiales bacterium]